MTTVNNTHDILDSRDVISRIDELTEMRDEWIEWQVGENTREDTPDPFGKEEQDELDMLVDLADEASAYAADWEYGKTLIHGSYFKEYAQELAEDCGMIDADATWPARCIDWDQAAEELKQDYTSVDYGGVEYWIR